MTVSAASQFDFFSLHDLVSRLTHAAKHETRKIVFLVGAPFSAARNGIPGVADVDGVIELIRLEFANDHETCREFDEQLRASSNPYQSAMLFLQARRGQDKLNSVIIKAVLQANATKTTLSGNANQDTAAMDAIDQDHSGWALSDAHAQLAGLASSYPEKFGNLILTTNFDPLIEMAFLRHQVPYYRTTLSRDGNLAQTSGNGCHIVHLHGYWHGQDTLHTPRQLTQDRPRLKASLAKVLRESIVVVTAYGGWDDVFTRTMIDVVLEDSTAPEIIWTFFGDREEDIVASNKKRLDDFGPGIDRGRVTLYKGIRFEQLFDHLSQKLLGPSLQRHNPTIVEEPHNAGNSLEFAFETLSNSKEIHGDAFDVTSYLPAATTLYGRDHEMKLLKDSVARIITINGMGGQGKSTLAAYFANNPGKFEKSFSFIDWRDCRELDDMLQGVLISLVLKMSDANVTPGMLKELKYESLVHTFVEKVKDRDGLIIFDNVDQYVDLQTGSPLSAVRSIIDSLLRARSQCTVIFTARPRIILESEQALELSLIGISSDATRSIFEAISGSSISDSDLGELTQTTGGHPLWVTLISAQVKTKSTSVKVIAESIKNGKGDLPEKTLASIWTTLTEKQMSLLRTIAELERPIPEDQIAEIEAELNYNQFTKALKALKALHLVTIRMAPDSKDVIDVHPLIRGYVRKHFPKSQREKFISRIVVVLDRRLGQFFALFKDKSFPTSVLEIWTHKIDLSINSEDFDTAIDSLTEIHSQLDDSGMGEEFLRLSKRVFQTVDWPTYCNKSKKFNKLVAAGIKNLVERDALADADNFLKIYEDSIEGAGAQYINLCDLRCYRYWFAAEFDQAIWWGERGTRLKSTSDVDSEYDCGHNLALARRDSGRVEEALAYFMGIATESDVLASAPADKQRPGAFYGNIGRCYALMGEIDKALTCFRKSAQLIEAKHDAILNFGYIRYWVAQALAQKGRIEDALYFYRAAIDRWKGLVPARASNIETEMEQLIDAYPELDRVRQVASWRIENRFMEWMRD